jgi:enamine deaminase RidA (YjgF/YER057c/UK114 family)
MTDTAETRLAQLGLALPDPQPPAFNYVPTVLAGDLLFVSGQLPWRDGRVEHVGKLGAEVTIDRGREAAQLCALNMLAQVRASCGELTRVRRCVKLGGFVNCTPGFTEHPKVIDAASELMVELFGEAGRHARAAVGCNALPRDVSVELEGIFQIA